MLSSSFLKNCWYVVAWSHEVVQAPLARQIAGVPIVLWRDSVGVVRALEDRCSHRAAPLSFGRCEGDAIRCMYHGLKFDGTGTCIEVPGQAHVPAKAKVRAFPIVEQASWIWAWLGEPELADQAQIPDLPWLDQNAWPYRPGVLQYSASAELVSDNLLDFSHLSFVHEGSFGGAEAIASTPAVVKALSNGIRVERDVKNVPPSPTSRRFSSFEGNVDRWFHYEYLVPGVLVLEAGTQPAEGEPGRGESGNTLRQFSCQAVTPETAGTCRYFFMITRDFRQDEAALTESIYEGGLLAFEEDRRMIEGQQARLKLFPGHQPVAIGADAALIQFRRLTSRLLLAESIDSRGKASDS